MISRDVPCYDLARDFVCRGRREGEDRWIRFGEDVCSSQHNLFGHFSDYGL